MSDDDIERFEEERELELYREYRDVLPMFTYVIETERRFYLANKVDVTHMDGGWVQVDLTDAWVWDMFRPARFVSSVRVMTRRDVNVEELARRDETTTIPDTPTVPKASAPTSAPCRTPRASGRAHGSSSARRTGPSAKHAAARHYRDRGYRVLARNWRCSIGELDLVLTRGDTLVFCEVKTPAGRGFGGGMGGRHGAEAAKLRALGRGLPADAAAQPRERSGSTSRACAASGSGRHQRTSSSSRTPSETARRVVEQASTSARWAR